MEPSDSLTEFYNSHDYRSKIRHAFGAEVGYGSLFEFSASASNEEAENKTGSREEVMKYALIVRERQRLMLDLENAADLQPYLDQNFKRAVAHLPTAEEPDEKPASYQEFIQLYGTHFASTLTLGGLAYQQVRVSTEEISSEKLKTNEFEASAKLAVASFTAGAKASRASDDARTQDQKMKIERSEITFSGGKGGLELYSGWIEEADAEPVPIMQRSVFSRLTELLTPALFPDDPEIDTKRQLLDDAIDEYLVTEGGTRGRYTHYQAPFHLYHHIGTLPRHQYHYHAQTNRIWPVNDTVVHTSDPPATLLFEPMAENDPDGAIVYTGDKHPVRLRVIEGNGYIEMNLENPQRARSDEILAHINPHPDLARSTWNIGLYTPGTANSDSRPLTSGDKVFFYRWDEPTHQYYILHRSGMYTLDALTFKGVGTTIPTSRTPESVFIVQVA